MKLSFSTLCCPRWTFPEIVGAAAAHGFDGIDLRGIGEEIDVTRTPVFGGEIDGTRDLMARHGLSIPCFNTSIALVTPAPERWEMMLDECRRYAVAAARIGSTYLRIFGGAVPKGMSRVEAGCMARRHVRQINKICAPHRCIPLVETHDEWATGAQMMEIIGEFSPEEAAVLWDVEHPCRAGENPASTAEVLRKHIRHVHFKDSVRRDGRSVPVLVGDGELPLKDVLQALGGIEYQGWICLETEKRWHPEDAPEPEQSLPRFVQWMQRAVKQER